MMTQRESKMHSNVQRALMAEAIDIHRKIAKLNSEDPNNDTMLFGLIAQRAALRNVIVTRLELMTFEQFHAALKHMTEEETK